MSATLVKEENCRACGVDIREGALFCYNCGGSVTYEDAAAGNDAAVSEAWFREEIAEEEHTGNAEEASAETSEAESPEGKNVVRKKREVRETSRLRSAAMLRRKARVFQKRRVEEVAWEEYEDDSNARYVIFAVVLTVLAACVFLLAIYLK